MIYVKKMQLNTTRAELNLIERKDFKELTASFKERDAVKYIKHLQNLSDEKYTNYLENKRLLSQSEQLFYWVVREKETQKYIGTMGLMPYMGSKTVFHIGFRISKDFQNKGFATELGNVVINFAKNKLKHKELFGLIMKENIASQTLLKKLGFVFLKSNFNTDYHIQLETYHLSL